MYAAAVPSRRNPVSGGLVGLRAGRFAGGTPEDGFGWHGKLAVTAWVRVSQLPCMPNGKKRWNKLISTHIWTSHHIFLPPENEQERKEGTAKVALAKVSKLPSPWVTQKGTFSTKELLKQFTVTVIYRCNIIENTQFVSGAQTYRLVQSILTAKGQHRNIWEIHLPCEYLLQLVQLMLDLGQTLNCPSYTSTVSVCYDLLFFTGWKKPRH